MTSELISNPVLKPRGKIGEFQPFSLWGREEDEIKRREEGGEREKKIGEKRYGKGENI